MDARSDQSPALKARRRKRDVIGLVAAVATAVFVAAVVVAASVVLLFASGFVPLAGLSGRSESNLGAVWPGVDCEGRQGRHREGRGRPTLQI